MEAPQLGMLQGNPASEKKKAVPTVLLTDSSMVSQNARARPVTTFYRWRKGGSDRELGGDQRHTQQVIGNAEGGTLPACP